MRIYVAHSRDLDFKKELYKPLRESRLDDIHEIILPHEDTGKLYSSEQFFGSSCDLVIAEVSYKSTSMGIELGWAHMHHLPIICIYKTGSKPSNGLRAVTNYFVEYSNPQEMISKLEQVINSL
jgi:hypothetical protein